ncbi:N-lysine methyltransferase setd6-like [Asterias amurensis]|uniref:N-lysine methyltransferase setd6-like n=1 Tax=Asterias amurensis TaxID=7602 RepID=UPI003AB25195
MAGAAKRQKVETLGQRDNLDNDAPTVFLKWCDDLGFNVNRKVRVGKQGSCSHYGMIAEDDIQKGETLFNVPRDALLHPATCSISSILKKGEVKLNSASGWVPLLLSLMYEYTNSESKWGPYLDACCPPDSDQLDQPMFWESETIAKELKRTGVPELVEKDEVNIRQEYKNIAVPFMKKHPKQFDLSIHTLELYRKMVAFVMAYSFTEPKKKTKPPQDDAEEEDEDDSDEDDYLEDGGPPMMVPMADILNHVSRNNARLQFGETSLSMVSTREIKKNEEVFNTYGQLPNWQLLQMYGFAEPYADNVYDTVDLSVNFLKDVSSAEAKFEFITDNWEAYGVDITIGCSEVINKWETCNILKMLSMTVEEFKAHEERLLDFERWEEDVEEDFYDDIYEDILTFDGLHKIPDTWKTLLNTCATRQLASYKNTLEQDLQLLEENQADPLQSRERHALNVRVGQMKILEKITQLTRVERSQDSS